ncbi:MAG: hypothetical protein ABW087_00355 [Candidatus Thiodiazotropha sp.]
MRIVFHQLSSLCCIGFLLTLSPCAFSAVDQQYQRWVFRGDGHPKVSLERQSNAQGREESGGQGALFTTMMGQLIHTENILQDSFSENRVLINDVKMGSSQINQKIGLLEKDIKALKKDWLDKLLPIIGTLLGAALGGIATYFLQNLQQKHERKRMHESAIFEAKQLIVQEQALRREKLYAPLKTLLGQSKVLYDQMCSQLTVKDTDNQYEWKEDESSTSGQSFGVIENGEWVPFRLLNKLPNVYRKGLGLDYLIDEIFNTGEQISELIKSSAGHVLPEQPELAITMQKYLAHFTVMREIRDSVIAKKPPKNYAVGAYPRGLNKQVDRGFELLTASIEKWESEISAYAGEIISEMSNGKT